MVRSKCSRRLHQADLSQSVRFTCQPSCWLGLLACLLLAACQSPFERTGPKFDARESSPAAVTNLNAVAVPAPPADPLPSAADEPFTAGPGDKLEIEILSDPSSRAVTTVGPDGKVYYYLLPGLDVWGLTLSQIRSKLQDELAKYVAAPQVSVSLRGIESKRVWLLGQLRNAGVYPMASPTTLLEAISSAGGLASASGPGPMESEDLVDLRRSFIIRQGQVLPVDFARLLREGDMSQNVLLRPDDFVYVPPALAREIYVLGAVGFSRPVPWTEESTLISTISSAGGTIKNAYLSHVGVVRGSLSEPKIAIVDYKAIVAGRAPDVRLHPRDIVYVPFTPYKNVVKYVNLILDTFARAVAINEGARAVSRDVAPVGVQIGIGAR